MMDRQKTHIFLFYLKDHIKAAIIYLVILAVLFGIAGIYDYGNVIKNMSYAAVLIVFFGICYGIIDYLSYRKKCMALLAAAERQGDRGNYLPKSSSYPEALYYDMICSMEKERRRMISEYDERKRDMADYYTMWIHQIKTPIAALRLLLQEEKQPLEELFKTEQYAEMALHYARLDSLSADLLFQKQDVCEMIKQAVKKYSILFIGSGLTFVMEEFSCQVVTDEKWFSFVVEQVLSNALKYTQKGSIRIYGLDKQGRKTREEACFAVIEDSGIGIRSEDLPRIFERGFTGYNGRFDKKSTGIGLYLCRQIMDRLSLTMQVKSKEGEGTRVILGFEQDNVTKM